MKDSWDIVCAPCRCRELTKAVWCRGPPSCWRHASHGHCCSYCRELTKAVWRGGPPSCWRHASHGHCCSCPAHHTCLQSLPEYVFSLFSPTTCMNNISFSAHFFCALTNLDRKTFQFLEKLMMLEETWSSDFSCLAPFLFLVFSRSPTCLTSGDGEREAGRGRFEFTPGLSQQPDPFFLGPKCLSLHSERKFLHWNHLWVISKHAENIIPKICAKPLRSSFLVWVTGLRNMRNYCKKPRDFEKVDFADSR